MTNDIRDFIPVNSSHELKTYQRILDDTAIIVLTDTAGTIKYVNKKFCEISGYDREEIIGKSTDILKSDLQNTDIYQQMDIMLQAGLVYKGEFLRRKKNDETYWEQVSVYPFTDQDDKVYQYAYLGSVITTFKNAMQIKDQFLMNMSHELRTPLHSLVSLSNLLIETPLTPEQNDYLENIQNATQLLMKMVEDMLDLNKIENGSLKLEQKAFAPEILIRSTSKMFIDKARARKLEFEIQYDEQLPEFLIGDPFRLKQIIIHLLDNAIKFTQSGKISLHCRLQEANGNQTVIEFVVEDTGVGIETENLNRILENFQQGKMDNTRIFGGQGLGLSIVHKLINLLDGNLSITSIIGQGTRVNCIIPFQNTNALKQADNPEDTEALIPTSRHIKVLIAEDVDINQLVIKKHMQKFGFIADFAENGKVALEKLRQGNYDIVLMDMQMPVLDGYDAIKKIRHEFPEPHKNIPVISITASVMGDAPAKCIEAGANDYVPKPYDVNDLRKKIETLIFQKNNNSSNFTHINNSNPMNHANGNQQPVSLVDLEYLEQLSEGDDDFSINMLSYFIDNTPAVMHEMKELYKAADWKALRNTAHKFKPQLTFMGIKSIFNDVEVIEQSAAKESQTERIPPLIEKVSTVCFQAMEELKIELEKLLDKNQ